ncbi:hypothetical protein ASPACDRAFT_80835 [Aspergillus aculeatus ATCC 16872]|uniref:DUF2423 domain-containing protein n=1 Tax=Aspergillus aculeatus (strain ATCC 16872 / CBS 172.66 / WB 5094) TaxID=690307 RepID=A0A1L9WMJ9_ASPA1|nr:uncharacterized protein ASPACDRAFT_80835 [Aspergillus aculeatus ATCC 16872]OJJ97381.1 hypothetical protein ASPACDRAFT_80835 [Aspergillus aculeatus ATCC 16872]
MAKSGRASVIKRNRANLRAIVFGPAVDARTERLSAKLQELAAQPKPNEGNSKMEMDSTRSDGQATDLNARIADSNEDMDVDHKPRDTHGRSKKSGRIQKNKKNRSSIVFRPHPSKAKRMSKKK